MYPQETQEEYNTKMIRAMIRARYETLGWDKEPPPIWRFKLDKTGTKLIPIDEMGAKPLF